MASPSANYKSKATERASFRSFWVVNIVLKPPQLKRSTLHGLRFVSSPSLPPHIHQFKVWYPTVCFLFIHICMVSFWIDLYFNDGYLSAFLALLRLHRVLGLGLGFPGTGGVPLAGLSGCLELELETSLIRFLSRQMKMGLCWVLLRGRLQRHLGHWMLKLPPKPLISSLAMLRVILTAHLRGSLPSSKLSIHCVKERLHIRSSLEFFNIKIPGKSRKICWPITSNCVSLWL